MIIKNGIYNCKCLLLTNNIVSFQFLKAIKYNNAKYEFAIKICIWSVDEPYLT